MSKTSVNQGSKVDRRRVILPTFFLAAQPIDLDVAHIKNQTQVSMSVLGADASASCSPRARVTDTASGSLAGCLRGVATMARLQRAPMRYRELARAEEVDGETVRLVQESRRCGGGSGLPGAALAEAWDRMYRACDPMIRALVRHGPVPVSSRDDRVQDIWKAVLTGLRQYDPARGPFAPWLAAVAVHVMYEHARAHRQPASLDAGRALQFPGREDDPVDQCEVCLVRERIAAALRRLQSRVSETNYRIVREHWIGGASFRQIAATVGLSEKQVRDRHHRAMKELRQLCSGRG